MTVGARDGLAGGVLARLEALEQRVSEWPTDESGFPVSPDARIVSAIELHNLVDEALPALLNIARAADRIREALEIEDDPHWTNSPSYRNLVRALAGLGGGE